MKLTLSIFALTAALLLTGCETTVVDRRPVHRSGYHGHHRDDHRHHDHDRNRDRDRDRDHDRRSDYRRSHYDNDRGRSDNRRDVVIVRDTRESRVSGRAGVEVSTSRGPTPYRRPGSWRD